MQKGRKWIFLRGLVRWKVHWGDFVEEFKKAFPQDEILLLDLPGFGDYYQKPSPTSMEGLIEHLEGLGVHVEQTDVQVPVEAAHAVEREDRVRVCGPVLRE